MAIDFPASPALGQQYVFAGVTYIFTAQGTWATNGTQFAPLNSPTFTGNPQAPTATAGDADNSIATTAFVMAAIASGGFSTGDVKPTLKIVADPGWVMFDDQGIGNPTSVGVHKGNEFHALFVLLFGITDDTGCPIYDSAGIVSSRSGFGNTQKLLGLPLLYILA